MFTLNNPESLLDLPDDFPTAKYIVYSEEIGENSTLHLQGYVEFTRPKRLSGVRKLLDGAHWEPRRGTPAQAAEYCKKMDDTHVSGPYEWGTLPHQGERSDLLATQNAITQGVTIEELWDQYYAVMVKFNRGIERYHGMKRPKRDFKTDVYVHCGPPGTGKTHYAYASSVDPYFVPRPTNGVVWFDGYTGQETVVLDDFYGWMPYSLLLNLLDAYPMQVSVKGGYVQFTARRIFITSNASPDTWYDYTKTGSPFEALERRITHYRYFDYDKVYQPDLNFSDFVKKFPFRY